MSRVAAFVLSAAALSFAPLAHAADVNAQKQQAFQTAPYTIAGTIQQKPSGSQLAITPYGQSSASTLQLDPSAPIFQGTGTISTAGLMPGVDVRVHYANNAGQPQAKPQQMAQLSGAGANPSATTAQNPTQVSSKFIESAKKNASGSQNGKVVALNGDKLQLDPYQKAAGNSELKFESNTPIFQGANQVSSTALTPGKDVRVFYKTHGKDRPSVVAIEILDPSQAQQLEKAERDVPNHAHDKK